MVGYTDFVKLFEVGRVDRDEVDTFVKRQPLLDGTPIESKCPDNMRHSQYAKQLMKQAEHETKRLYGILEQKYGKTDTYSESYAPAENK